MTSGQKAAGRTLWRTRIRRWWRKGEWPLIVLASLATVFLGYVGFTKLFAAGGEARSVWDRFYLALQLFTLESGSIAGLKTWELEVARLLAPSLAAYAAIRALMAVLHNQVQAFRLRFMTDHVVICGLGRKGRLLAKNFLAAGYRVVAVEKDARRESIGPCRDEGALIVIGDAASPAVLRKANVQRARTLISVCGDDGVDAETAVRASGLARRPRRGALACFAHIVDPRLCALLREHELLADKTDAFQLEFFNVYDLGAHVLLADDFPFGAEENRPAAPHLVIVGFGRLGRSLAVHAARRWRSKHRETGQFLRLTIVDREAIRKTELLAVQYPQLSGVCRLIPAQMDIASPEFQEARFLFDGDGRRDVDAIYVCLGQDALGFAAALLLVQTVRASNVPIVVRMTQDMGLAALLSKAEGSPGGFDNLRAFSLMDRICRPEIILGGVHEMIARGLHEAYVRQQVHLGYSTASNPSMVPWERLRDELKASNRDQANHLGVKMKAVDCRIGLLTTWEAELFEFTPEEVEILGRMEHDRWMEDLRRRGWKYAPGKKNPEKKTHPCLVPWTELSEEVKDYDRIFIRELPKILAEVDLQVYRLSHKA